MQQVKCFNKKEKKTSFYFIDWDLVHTRLLQGIELKEKRRKKIKNI